MSERSEQGYDITRRITDLVNSGELYTVASDISAQYLARLQEAKHAALPDEESPRVDRAIAEWTKLSEIVESGFDGYALRNLSGAGDRFRITLTPQDKIRINPLDGKRIVDLYGDPVNELQMRVSRHTGRDSLSRDPDRVLRSWDYQLEIILYESKFDLEIKEPVFEELSGMLIKFRGNGEIEAFPTKYDGLSRYIGDTAIDFDPKHKVDAENLERSVKMLGLVG